MSHHDYPYSQGDRLNDRNTYFYSEFRGQAFLADWHESRSVALAALPAPLAIAVSAADPSDTADTAKLLAYLLHTDVEDARVDGLLQRFEVSKRLYRRYDRDFKAVRESGYDALDLYLQFGALCVQRQSRPAALRFLNALLKVVDSLISVRERLSCEQGAHLAWLIRAERAWVQSVATGAGVRVDT